MASASSQIIVASGSVDKILTCMVLPVLQLHIVTEQDMDHSHWLLSRVTSDMKPVLGQTLLFVYAWVTATYGLFGESALSLRHIYSGSSVLWPLATEGRQADANIVKSLRRQLERKDVTVESSFAQRFVERLLVIHMSKLVPKVSAVWSTTFDVSYN